MAATNQEVCKVPVPFLAYSVVFATVTFHRESNKNNDNLHSLKVSWSVLNRWSTQGDGHCPRLSWRYHRHKCTSLVWRHVIGMGLVLWAYAPEWKWCRAYACYAFRMTPNQCFYCGAWGLSWADGSNRLCALAGGRPTPLDTSAWTAKEINATLNQGSSREARGLQSLSRRDQHVPFKVEPISVQTNPVRGKCSDLCLSGRNE